MKQKVEEEDSTLFIPAPLLKLGHSFSGSGTETYTISYPGSQAFRLELNCTTSFPGSPACRHQETSLPL